jgi:hypothetical protein
MKQLGPTSGFPVLGEPSEAPSMVRLLSLGDALFSTWRERPEKNEIRNAS